MSRRPLALGILLTLAMERCAVRSRGSGLDETDCATLALGVGGMWALAELMAWPDASQVAAQDAIARAWARRRGRVSAAAPRPSLARELLRRQHAWRGIQVVYPLGVGDERPLAHL